MPRSSGSCLKVLFCLFQFYLKASADCSYHCEAYDCPCDCIKEEIRCEHRNVSVISRFLAHRRYKTADFGSNQIDTIKKHQFHHDCWKYLEDLSLSANQIDQVEEYSFVRLLKLERLFLNHNNIKLLHKHTFAGLKNLKRLYLNNNQINKLFKEVFNPFRKTLQLLYLQENKIECISKNTFDHFKQLRTLDLSKNKLAKLDSRFLHTTVKINHLFLDGNPWRCDRVSACLSYYVLAQKLKSDGTKLNLHGDMLCTEPAKFENVNMNFIIDIYDCNNTLLTIKDNGGNNGCMALPNIARIIILILLICLTV